jgi:sorbitol/mannitol transport system substrate-binding protein
MRWTVPLASIAILLVIGTAAIVAGRGDDDHAGARPRAGGAMNVAIVDTPHTKNLAHLTPSLFTSPTNIDVHYTILDEGTLREVMTRDVAAGGRQFDVVMIGPYEAPQFGRAGYITDLTRMASSDRAYALGDIIPSVRNALSSEGKLAWRYISWATGPRYLQEAGRRIAGGWAAIPPGTRRSTYRIPEYGKAACALARPTLDAIESAPVDHPGTSRRPATRASGTSASPSSSTSATSAPSSSRR